MFQVTGSFVCREGDNAMADINQKIWRIVGFIAAIVALVVLVTVPVVARPNTGLIAFLPFGSSPVAPVESYKAEFTDNIHLWNVVRWQKDTAFELEHEDSCDSGQCGFLELGVDKPESYAIASPLILGPQRPYVIEFRARFHEREDKHQLGAVFGADWQAAPCPGDNNSACFNHYYEFRVRYRDVNGDEFLEYRLRRIDGHDGNNIEQGEDLVDWTRADGVTAGNWIKWQVRYGVRGDITFKANNDELPGSAQDSRYDDPSYFGVLSRAGDVGNVQARFDEYAIMLDQ